VLLPRATDPVQNRARLTPAGSLGRSPPTRLPPHYSPPCPMSWTPSDQQSASKATVVASSTAEIHQRCPWPEPAQRQPRLEPRVASPLRSPTSGDVGRRVAHSATTDGERNRTKL